MPKKKMPRKNSTKKNQIDWKFIILLILILLIGLGIFAVNQRLTYQSAATWKPSKDSNYSYNDKTGRYEWDAQRYLDRIRGKNPDLEKAKRDAVKRGDLRDARDRWEKNTSPKSRYDKD